MTWVRTNVTEVQSDFGTVDFVLSGLGTKLLGYEVAWVQIYFGTKGLGYEVTWIQSDLGTK